MEISVLLFITITVICKSVTAQNAAFDQDEIKKIYLDKLLVTISNETTVSLESLENYFEKHSLHKNDKANITRCIKNGTNNVLKLDEECLLNSVSYFIWIIL